MMNPGGSIKDRIGLSMIEEAEKRGELEAGRHDRRSDGRQHRPGPGAGRGAEGLSADSRVARQDEPGEDLQSARAGCGSRADAFGCRQGSSGVLPGSGREPSRSERGAYFINQFANPDNPKAHEKTTAPEIWEQMEQRLDAVVVGVGSSGTIAGLAAYFKTACAARGAGARRSAAARSSRSTSRPAR